MLPLLFLLFILLPIAELWLIIEIGGSIGVPPTLALLIVDSLVGAALARSQGRAAWERFNACHGRGPHPGQGGLRRRDDHPRRRAPPHPRLHHGHLRAGPPHPADSRPHPCLPHPPGRAPWRGAHSGWPSSATPSDPAAGPRPGQDYDYEGSASEVTEPPPELGPGPSRERAWLTGSPSSSRPGSGSPGTTWTGRARTSPPSEPSAQWRLEGELGAGHTALRGAHGLDRRRAPCSCSPAARPGGADGHDAESPRAVLVSALGRGEGDRGGAGLDPVLGERPGRAGRPRALRGRRRLPRARRRRRQAGIGRGRGPLRREHAWLDFRLDGEPGDAILDIVHA